MVARITDLHYKEVINIQDGRRLGYVGDAEIDLECGEVRSLIVPGRCRFFGLFGREDDYILPWDCISRIGDDIILVEVSGEHMRGKRDTKKRGIF